VFVDFIPENLEEGIIYISLKYSTAAHLCCCGCGQEVITPLNPAKWYLTEKNGIISLHPSIGNWSLPCKSHYWISQNRVLWAGEISSEMISAVQARDLHDIKALTTKSLWQRFVHWFNKLRSKFIG
jgi:hypothetical protein